MQGGWKKCGWRGFELRSERAYTGAEGELRSGFLIISCPKFTYLFREFVALLAAPLGWIVRWPLEKPIS
jgi:hypothetical protein